MNNREINVLDESFLAYVFKKSKKNPTLIYVGTNKGLMIIKDGNIIGPFGEGEIRSIEEDLDGIIWLDIVDKGVGKMVFDENYSKVDNFKIYDFGLQKKFSLKKIHLIGNDLVFLGQGKIVKFNKEDDTFVDFVPLNTFFENDEIHDFIQNVEGDVWIIAGDNNRLFRLSPKFSENSANLVLSYSVNKNSFLRIRNFRLQNIFLADDNLVWLGSSEGVLNFNSKVLLNQKNFRKEFEVVINNVNWGGDFEAEEDGVILLKEENNSASFTYGGVFFDGKEEIVYQTWLEGKDNFWSKWTKDISENFVNLKAGDYAFRVRARNIYNRFSDETFVQFKVLPVEKSYFLFFVFSGSFLFLLILGFGFCLRNINQKRLLLEDQGKMLEAAENYMVAISLFNQEEFQKARVLFKKCLVIYPDDKVCLNYVERCERRGW